MLQVTRPVQIVVQDEMVIAFMEDGSVWSRERASAEWIESDPIPGTDRWNTWPDEKNAREKHTVRRGSHSTFDQG